MGNLKFHEFFMSFFLLLFIRLSQNHIASDIIDSLNVSKPIFKKYISETSLYFSFILPGFNMVVERMVGCRVEANCLLMEPKSFEQMQGSVEKKKLLK